MDGRLSGARVVPTDQRVLGIAGLVVAQGLDLVTTLYGLRAPQIVELNPVATASMARFGEVPGLLVLACLTIVAVVVVTETAVRRYGDRVLSAGTLRWLGYAPHVCLSVAAALNNAVLVSLV